MTCRAPFTLKSLCRSTAARTGVLELGRGKIQTPVFMPVGTQAAVRGLPPHWLRDVGAQIILANTYHLHQRPGEQLIEKLGGLHRFMAVDLPILTDSGGFQVFSLKKKELSEDGVSFAYELDGKKTFLSPETSMAIQQSLGSDIAMAFDECLPADADRDTVAVSIDRTARWAERCLAAHTKPDQSLFGIVQGGMFGDLRQRSTHQITSLPFDGYAIGGLSVGEGPEKMNAVLAETMPLMPTDKARYLMGVGRPQDLVDGVALGVDMFDCVIPTRHARGGAIYTFQGRIRITHSRYRRDAYPIDTACTCYTCRNFSRAYLHHLFEIGEVLGSTLATLHNLQFFGDLMAKVRATIEDGTFMQFRKDIHALYPEKDEEAESVEAARRRFAEDALPVRERAEAPGRYDLEPSARPSRGMGPGPLRDGPAPRPPAPAPRGAPSGGPSRTADRGPGPGPSRTADRGPSAGPSRAADRGPGAGPSRAADRGPGAGPSRAPERATPRSNEARPAKPAPASRGGGPGPKAGPTGASGRGGARKDRR
jgi:queuine tRNA-ribosyltransferase